MKNVLRAALAGIPILAAILLVCFAPAQVVTRPESDTRRKYEAVCSYTASTSTPSLTIHVPSTVTGTRLRFGYITVRTPQAADAVFEWGGATPSGGTTAEVRKQNTTTAQAATVLCDATSATPSMSKTLKLSSTDTDYAFSAANDEFLPGRLSGRTLRVTLSTAVTGSGVISVEFTEGL
jgi:hypothetical protein